MGQINPSLREADKLDGLSRCSSDEKSCWVSHTDVFGGVNDEAAGNIFWVLTRGQHPSEPIDGSVGVRAANAFDKSANDVVVLILAVSESFKIGRRLGMG